MLAILSLSIAQLNGALPLISSQILFSHAKSYAMMEAAEIELKTALSYKDVMIPRDLRGADLDSALMTRHNVSNYLGI
jgi:hypothetical protein